MTPAEIEIEKTEVGHRTLVLTSKSTDPHLLHPFSVFSLDLARGNASPIARFASEGAARFAHQRLVRRLTDEHTAREKARGAS